MAYDKGNYNAMLRRISSTATVDEMRKVEKSMNALWEIGAFTLSEFKRLDAAWCDRMDQLERRER